MRVEWALVQVPLLNKRPFNSHARPLNAHARPLNGEGQSFSTGA